MKPPSTLPSLSSGGSNKPRISNILVPVDFSELSLQAISKAKRLATRFGATVHLAYVQRYAYSAAYSSPSVPVHTASIDFEELRQAAAERLQELAREHGLTGTCRAEIGAAPYDLICWIARKIGADLIITSTHGHTGLKRALMGSTAERLVQHAPCPVLVVREPQRKKAARSKSAADSVNTLLVPVDFSDCSLAGLNYAIELARKLCARIIVLHVVDLGPVVVADGYALLFDPADFEKEALQDAEKRMSDFVRRAKFREIRFQTQVIAGSAVEAICRVAATEDADLIVTATHGLTGLKHVLIGSTAEVVVRHAPCSVLVVPSHPEARDRKPGPHMTTSKAGSPTATRGRKSLPAAAQPARKITRHPAPERRRANKYREPHAA